MESAEAIEIICQKCHSTMACSECVSPDHNRIVNETMKTTHKKCDTRRDAPMTKMSNKRTQRGNCRCWWHEDMYKLKWQSGCYLKATDPVRENMCHCLLKMGRSDILAAIRQLTNYVLALMMHLPSRHNDAHALMATTTTTSIKLHDLIPCEFIACKCWFQQLFTGLAV